MVKIKLNTYEYQIDGYSRTTNLTGDNTITSSAYINISNGDTTINELLGVDISSIEIYADDVLIYDLKNVDAEITSINENLVNDKMFYNVTLTFKFNI